MVHWGGESFDLQVSNTVAGFGEEFELQGWVTVLKHLEGISRLQFTCIIVLT